VLARIDDRDFKVRWTRPGRRRRGTSAVGASGSARGQEAVIDAQGDHPRRHRDQDFRQSMKTSVTLIWLHGYGSCRMRNRRNRATPVPSPILRDTANPPPRAKAGRARSKAEIRPGRTQPGARLRPAAQAELNLGYTTSRARSTRGRQPTAFASASQWQAGTQLMSLVLPSGAYVVANFKKPSSPSARRPAGRRRVDMFPPARCMPCRLACACQRQEFARCPRHATAISPRWCSASR